MKQRQYKRIGEKLTTETRKTGICEYEANEILHIKRERLRGRAKGQGLRKKELEVKKKGETNQMRKERASRGTSDEKTLVQCSPIGGLFLLLHFYLIRSVESFSVISSVCPFFSLSITATLYLRFNRKKLGFEKERVRRRVGKKKKVSRHKKDSLFAHHALAISDLSVI